MRRRLRRLRRHPFGFWLITFLLAALTFSFVAGVDARASLVEQRWGRVVSVVVMARPVSAGAVVGRRDVVVAAVPARLAVAGALRSLDSAVGRVALVELERGELVLRSRLAPDGLRGVAALVPPGMRAVAVPTGEGALSLSVGDRVDALATFELAPNESATAAESATAGAAESLSAAESVAPTVVVVEGAVVVEVRDDAITLAVPAPAAPRLAYALTHATLTLTISTFSTAAGAVEKEVWR